MNNQLFGVNVSVKLDKTEIYPYKIFVKITFYNSEFKERIKNVIHSKNLVFKVKERGFITKKTL